MTGMTVVVGSANLDVIAAAERRPDPGETVLGRLLVEVPGGKGLNQALAAAAMGPTAFIGNLGTDDAGSALLIALTEHGVDTSHVTRAATRTGRAIVTLTPDAENTIVVFPLANATVRADLALAGLEDLGPAVVLAQLEVPIAVVTAVAQWCVIRGVRFVLNPSPMAALDPAVVRAADPVVVNCGEARALLAAAGGGHCAVDDARLLALRLVSLAHTAVVTDGPRGAVVAHRDGWTIPIPALAVSAIDTTGAGDMFAGTLAAGLAAGEALVDAAQTAVLRASQVVAIARVDR